MLSQSFASLPIVTIGRRGDKSYTVRSRDRCHDYDFRLSQYATYIQLSYTAVGKCETILFASTELNATLTQVVVSFTDSSTSLHINGKAMLMPSGTHFLTPHIDNWNATYGLQLFSDNVLPTYDIANAPDEVFAGAIHIVKLFDYALNHDDISILFQAGLRNSKTVDGFEVTTTIVDDNNKTTTIVSPTGVVPSRLTASYSNILLVEGKVDKSSFTVGGYVYGVNVSTILMEIVSLPSQGKLSYNGVTLQVGDRIPTTANYSSSLRYGGLAEHFFNIANTTSNGVYLGLTPESFEYRLIEVNQSGGVLGMSATVRPIIEVVNVNDAPEELVVPSEIYLTGEKSPQGRDMYIINGIHLDDSKDRNVDKVRVEIEVVRGSGDMQLNSEYLELANFADCSVRRYSNWKCRGNGKGRIMTFIAEPGNVDSILSDMIFTPYFYDEQDEIIISIYDGEGGDCLDAEEHRLYGNAQLSVHQRCTCTQGSIRIPKPSDTKLLPGAGDLDTKGDMNFLQRTWTTVFGWFGNSYIAVAVFGIVFLIILGIVGCCYMRYRKRKTAKRVQVLKHAKNDLCTKPSTTPAADASDMA